MRPVRAGIGGRLDISGIGAGLLFRQSERGELLARDERRQPSLFLFPRPEQE